VPSVNQEGDGPDVLVDPKRRPFVTDKLNVDSEDEEYIEVVKSHWSSIKTSFR
jgi:hypothetical protein